MPASDLTWESTIKPVFQVYGTKRKVNVTEPCDSMLDTSHDPQACQAKRMCLTAQHQQQFPMTSPQNLMTSHPNPATSHPNLTEQQHELNAPHDTVMEDAPMREQPTHQHQLLHPVNRQLGQIAAMHGERVPSPWPSEHDSAVHDARNGLATNPAHNFSHEQPLPQQNTQHIMDLDDETFNTDATQPAILHGDFVPHPAHYDARLNHIGIENSPPHHVRCYCRPSWDGVLANKPYVSDYY